MKKKTPAEIKSRIEKGVPIPRHPESASRGRGNLRFPHWLDLQIAKDGSTGDCAVYEDTPYNRHFILQAKCNYNRRKTGSFAGRRFIHRYEVQHGEPVIVIQRIV